MSQLSLNLDASQITAFLTCPRMWYYQYRLNIEPVDRTHEAFSKGTIIHGLMERYYKNIASGWQKASKIAIDALSEQKETLEISKEDLQLLISRFLLYAAKYQNDLIPAVHNGKPVIESGFSYPLLDNNLFLFVLEGRTDLVAQFDNQIVVVDHKSQSRYYQFYSHSVQFLSYSLALRTNRFMMNVIGLQEKLLPKHMFRQLFYYSNTKLDNWKNRLIEIFYEVVSATVHERYDKRESSCGGKFNRPCDYCKICEEENPEIVQSIIKTKYKERPPWSPWSEDDD